MKNVLFLFITLVITTTCFAKKVVITAQDFLFAPMNTTVVIGDTIMFTWINGVHTSTSNVIPSGAAPWDMSLDVTNQSFIYIPSKTGTYSYVCTPHASMGMSGTFTVTSTVGVSAIYDLSALAILPNPASSYISIQFGQLTGRADVYITDLTGRVVYGTSFRNVEKANIDVSALRDGLYIVYGQNERGRFAGKLMVGH